MQTEELKNQTENGETIRLIKECEDSSDENDKLIVKVVEKDKRIAELEAALRDTTSMLEKSSNLMDHLSRITDHDSLLRFQQVFDEHVHWQRNYAHEAREVIVKAQAALKGGVK